MPALTTIRQNTNHLALALTFRVGGVAQDVTGATLTAKLLRLDVAPPGSPSVATTGTLTVSTGTNGAFTYQPSLADTATAGEFELQVKAVYGDATISFSDPILIDIVAAI